jgi:membrane-associated protease RseP (regulator of RpoE activity)
MSSPRHLWSGKWMDESESAAADVERLRRLREAEEPPSEQEPTPAPREPQPPRQRRTFTELIAPLIAAWRALAADAASWGAAIRSRLGSISPRTVGLTLAATVAGAAVALGAAALAGGSGDHASSSAAARSGPPVGWLGVQTTTSTSGIPGATVEVVEPNGPAAKAGISTGDVITQVNGQPITSSGGLASALAQMQPGQEIQLQVRRAGQMLIVDTKLTSRPPGVP